MNGKTVSKDINVSVASSLPATVSHSVTLPKHNLGWGGHDEKVITQKFTEGLMQTFNVNTTTKLKSSYTLSQYPGSSSDYKCASATLTTCSTKFIHSSVDSNGNREQIYEHTATNGTHTLVITETNTSS